MTDMSITVFSREDFGELRTSEINGEVWFCLADVCRPLGLRPTMVKERLKQDTVITIDHTDSVGRPKEMLFVNEANLYRAIFQSRKPEAEAFTDWVTEEILPSIRKTGSYTAPVALTPAQLLAQQAQLLVDLERRTQETAARTEAVAQKLDKAVAIFSKPSVDHWKDDMDKAIHDLCAVLGWPEMTVRGQMYAELEREVKCNVGARLTRLRTRKKKCGVTRREYMALTKLDAIAEDRRLKPVFESIVRQWQAKICEG